MRTFAIIVVISLNFMLGCHSQKDQWRLKRVYPNFENNFYTNSKKEKFLIDLEFINNNLDQCKLTNNGNWLSIETSKPNLRRFGLPLGYHVRKSSDTIYVVFPLEHNPTPVKNIYEEQVYFVVLFEDSQNLVLKYYYMKNAYSNNFIFHFYKDN